LRGLCDLIGARSDARTAPFAHAPLPH
jgi:hypothetical protein